MYAILRPLKLVIWMSGSDQQTTHGCINTTFIAMELWHVLNLFCLYGQVKELTSRKSAGTCCSKNRDKSTTSVRTNIQVFWDVKLQRLLGMNDPRDEGTTRLRNVCNYLSVDRTWHLLRVVFSSTPLRATRISQTQDSLQHYLHCSVYVLYSGVPAMTHVPSKGETQHLSPTFLGIYTTRTGSVMYR